jgi:predicted N-formylglutamate amidohydrolase
MPKAPIDLPLRFSMHGFASHTAPDRLLCADEPEAVRLQGETRGSSFVLICDHASARVPRQLANLGLATSQLEQHIGWDIGAAALGARLAERLGAALICQQYSRLVIDCNRPPGSAESILSVSDGLRIPGNAELRPAAAAARHAEIFEPYHRCIRDTLDARRRAGRPSVLIALHSFTPRFQGFDRPWHIGLLYQRDARLARRLGPALRADGRWQVGDNEPYAVGDDTDHSIPEHGERRGLPHVGIELRQDLIADAAGQQAWAEHLAQVLAPLERELAALPAEPAR